ncbi:uncharacterized protein LOC130981801 isoform X2 [Arachis stenosperma]|uniref:uncharacterized protein LOC130981801 isoform X2 n=1 Tax=Arachis stenosperma TaxID=217475 RepID=UPI0025ABBED7|nr:uncharacterized protein LOC130981801 isoform X2 [Arachis stenosperma]
MHLAHQLFDLMTVSSTKLPFVLLLLLLLLPSLGLWVGTFVSLKNTPLSLSALPLLLFSLPLTSLLRTFRMAVYGLLILGPSQHLWFNHLSKILPKRDVSATLKKIFMGQAVFGPVINTVFFTYNGAVQGESVPQIITRLKRDLLPTMIGGAMFWPACDFVTFKFAPVHLQPLLNSSCAYVWTIYLTYMANREK